MRLSQRVHPQPRASIATLRLASCGVRCAPPRTARGSRPDRARVASPVHSSRAMLPALLLLVVAAQPAQHPPLEGQGLRGSFGLLLRVPVHSHFPVVGEVDATYESLHLVTLEPASDGTLVQRERTCSVQIEEDLSLFDLHISPRAVRTVPEARADGRLFQRDGRWHYAVTLPKRYLGMKPHTDELPASSADGAVRDTDSDGNPGLTLALTTPVGTVDVFIVQRDQAALSGEVKSASLVEGKVEVLKLEQRVIGTRPSLTDEMDLRMVAKDNASFSLFRLPPGVGCDELGEGRWAAHLDDARRLATLEQEGSATLAAEAWAAP